MLKPHLLFLVYVYILVERARARSAKLLVGFVAGTLVLGAAPVLLDPSIWREYFEAFRAWPSYFQTPTIGSWIQFFYPEVPLIRFLPAFIAATFSIPFFWFRLRAVRPSWRFVASLSTISLAMSPYGWSYDQVLFLPLVLCLLRHSLASFVAVVMIHLLGFPWAGDVPMQNLVWYPPTLGVVAAYFLWDDLKGTSAESLKEGLSVT